MIDCFLHARRSTTFHKIENLFCKNPTTIVKGHLKGKIVKRQPSGGRDNNNGKLVKLSRSRNKKLEIKLFSLLLVHFVLS